MECNTLVASFRSYILSTDVKKSSVSYNTESEIKVLDNLKQIILGHHFRVSKCSCDRILILLDRADSRVPKT